MNTDDNARLAASQMASITLDNLLINFTTEFQRIWDNRRSKSKPCTFWRPTPAPDLLPGFFPLGDFAFPGHDSINDQRVVAVVCEGEIQSGDSSKDKALSPPTDFEQVWRSAGSTTDADCTIWRPVPPDGYIALGLVCSDRDKPSLNTVRCVRADLVIGAFVGDFIWNDKGSGAKQDFSAWSVQPSAAAAGEIYFAPGTFIGVNGHTRPTTHIPAYSLRMPIPVQANSPPTAPTLSGEGQPSPVETATITQIARLPWFTITDPDLNPVAQSRTSPFYRMERTDQYVLVGYNHNNGTEARTVKWTAPRVQSAERLQAFADITSVEIASQWPIDMQSGSVMFSARLSDNFAHNEISSSLWYNTAAMEVVTLVAKNKAVAVYQVQSDYRLLRENGTEVAPGISYTDANSLHMTEFPPEKENEITASPLPVTNESTTTDNAP